MNFLLEKGHHQRIGRTHRYQTANGKAESTEEATACVTDLDVFVSMVLLADTRSACFFFCEEHGLLDEWERESLQLWGRFYGASLGTMCRLWQYLKNLVFPASQSRRRAADCMSHVSRETCRERFQNDFNLVKKASLVNVTAPPSPPPHSRNVVVEQPGKSAETTPDDLRMSPWASP